MYVSLCESVCAHVCGCGHAYVRMLVCGACVCVGRVLAQIQAKMTRQIDLKTLGGDRV